MIEFNGIKWYRYQGALLPRVAPHHEITLTKKEQKELLDISKAFFLRYTDKWDLDGGEFWYVIKDEQEGMANYKSKIRNQIKKGIKNCIVKKVDKNIIVNDGYKIYLNAFKKYTTFHKPMPYGQFKNQILNSNDDFWAVFTHKDQLIAYANNFIENSMCHYNSMKFNPNYLYLYPSYALLFAMNEYYINKCGYSYVSDGARSIAHDTNIQEFMIKKFAFKKVYCRLNIIYRWDILIIINLLYPFKNVIKRVNNHIFEKLYILLKQEEIRRSFE